MFLMGILRFWNRKVYFLPDSYPHTKKLWHQWSMWGNLEKYCILAEIVLFVLVQNYMSISMFFSSAVLMSFLEWSIHSGTFNYPPLD